MNRQGNEFHALVVEDDEAIADMLSIALEDEGYHFTCVRNGGDALQWLQGADLLPNVILLDLMMPIMNGLQFRSAQKQDWRISHIPVVFLSATNNQELLRQVADEGSTLLAKPIDFTALWHTLQTIKDAA